MMSIELKTVLKWPKNIDFCTEFGQSGRLQGDNEMILEYLHALSELNIRMHAIRSTE